MFSEKYGPWALIVGGSEGVGASLAMKIAQKGLNVALTARKPEPLAKVAAAIRTDTGVDVRILSADLTAADGPERVIRALGDLEIGLLVYNAGGSAPFGEMVDLGLGQAMQSVLLNAVGQTKLTHHFGGRFKKRRRGGIILTGSNASCAAIAGLTTYCAAKAYTHTLGEGLWYELKPHGVDVLTLNLGVTKTPALARLGLPVDSPDFPGADPDHIAEEALLHLADGPVWVAENSVAYIEQFRGLSRAEAVERASKAVAELSASH